MPKDQQLHIAQEIYGRIKFEVSALADEDIAWKITEYYALITGRQPTEWEDSIGLVLLTLEAEGLIPDIYRIKNALDSLTLQRLPH